LPLEADRGPHVFRADRSSEIRFPLSRTMF
jgi:hypothetical protein